MAGKVILKQAAFRNYLTNPNGPVAQDLERRAQNVLQKAKDTAPEDTGDLKDSLRVVKTTQRGLPVARITSRMPYAAAVVRGTGNYSGTPPYGPESPLGQWGARHGFTTKRALYNLARKIARVGTQAEAGNMTGTSPRNGNSRWLTEALQEARR